MYSISRITEGIGIENLEEWSHWAEHSSALATPLRINTTARRAVHTLIGSNDAFRTKTREFILTAKYSLGSQVLSKLGGEGVGSKGPRRPLSPRRFFLISVTDQPQGTERTLRRNAIGNIRLFVGQIGISDYDESG